MRRALLATLLLLACHCGRPEPTPRPPAAAAPRPVLTSAQARQLSADHFTLGHDRLDLRQQQRLARARSLFRQACTALADNRCTQGLRQLDQVKQLIELDLHRLPLARERRTVGQLRVQTREWLAETERARRQRQRAAARDAAMGHD